MQSYTYLIFLVVEFVLSQAEVNFNQIEGYDGYKNNSYNKPSYGCETKTRTIASVVTNTSTKAVTIKPTTCPGPPCIPKTIILTSISVANGTKTVTVQQTYCPTIPYTPEATMLSTVFTYP